MKPLAPATDIRPPVRGTFVQTDRATHEAWARLTARRPAASAVLHLLSGNIGHQNAVVVSQKTIAKILGFTDRTIRSAISELEAGQWLQVVRIGAGRECAYVLNDKVAWADKRDNLRLSRFSAEVIVVSAWPKRFCNSSVSMRSVFQIIDRSLIPTSPMRA